MINFSLKIDVQGMPEKKLAQVADWRLRPLPTALRVYARHDSHALLRAWNLMKEEVSQY